MAGELWGAEWQAAVEVTPGTPVTTSTRIMYFAPDSVLAREREPRPHKFATGTRDNTRAMTLGPVVAGGSVSMPLSASEIIELLLMGIRGAVTPSTPAGTVRLWAFTPGAGALDAASLKWDDGARVWIGSGCMVNSLNFAGSANGENMVTAELFGRSVAAGSLTGALTSRVPDFIEGWETKLFIDAFAGTPGTTNIAGTLISWDITITNNLGRKYFADNTNATGGVVIGELEVEASLVFEAAPAAALTQFDAWDAVTKKLVRLEFGQNETIESTYKKFVSIDIPGAWSAVDLGGDDNGSRTYEFSLQYVYDVTNAFGLQIKAQNTRAAAWT